MTETTLRPAEAPEDDLAGVDWLEVSGALRTLSLAYIVKAFDWLDQSIKADTPDGTTILYATGAAFRDAGQLGDAIGEVLMAYERAAVTV